MYSATKVFPFLHGAPSGTIARGVFFFFFDGTIATFVHRRIEDHEGSDPQLVCILCAIVSVCAPIIVGHCSNHALRLLWRPFLSGSDNAVC